MFLGNVGVCLQCIVHLTRDTNFDCVWKQHAWFDLSCRECMLAAAVLGGEAFLFITLYFLLPDDCKTFLNDTNTPPVYI